MHRFLKRTALRVLWCGAVASLMLSMAAGCSDTRYQNTRVEAGFEGGDAPGLDEDDSAPGLEDIGRNEENVVYDEVGDSWDDSGCRGLTWVARRELGEAVLVGTDDTSDPYQGDTSCSATLPILCLNVTGAATPAGLSPDFYQGWSRGVVALTAPVEGYALTSWDEADARCMEAFGPGWAMGEFHDGGGGWNWWAYGAIDPDVRFWVAIDDKPANPWNSAP